MNFGICLFVMLLRHDLAQRYPVSVKRGGNRHAGGGQQPCAGTGCRAGEEVLEEGLEAVSKIVLAVLLVVLFGLGIQNYGNAMTAVNSRRWRPKDTESDRYPG